MCGFGNRQRGKIIINTKNFSHIVNKEIIKLLIVLFYNRIIFE